MADDDVQLTDLEVIQRYSLAVRGASASRADLISTLQADLAWLKGGRRATRTTAQDEPEATGADKPAPTRARRSPAKRLAKG